MPWTNFFQQKPNFHSKLLKNAKNNSFLFYYGLFTLFCYADCVLSFTSSALFVIRIWSKYFKRKKINKYYLFLLCISKHKPKVTKENIKSKEGKKWSASSHYFIEFWKSDVDHSFGMGFEAFGLQLPWFWSSFTWFVNRVCWLLSFATTYFEGNNIELL